jgi:hypothetical protein
MNRFVAVILLASAPASAQQIELGAILGYTTAVGLERTAEEVDELVIDDSITWGARGAYFVTERFGVEGLWTYQPTDLLMTTDSTATVFEMTVSQIYGHVVYQMRDASVVLRPFIFGGGGATFFDATDLDDDVKPAWDVGAGLKWFLKRGLGFEGRVRYKSTNLREAADETCGPFDFCQGSLGHVDITTSVVVRF